MANSTTNYSKYKIVYQSANDSPISDLKLVDSNMYPFVSTAEFIEVFGYLTGIISKPSSINPNDFPVYEQLDQLFCNNSTVSSIINLLKN